MRKKKKVGWNIGIGKIFSYRVPLSEQILFAKHLSMMLKSGITEVESLRIISDQIKSGGLKNILQKAIVSVENGQFLSEALMPYKATFGDLFINIIKLGELSGTLPQNLEYLANEITKKHKLINEVRGALIYPIVILIATIAVVGGLVIFILPKILPIFQSLNVTLPITTRILISTASILNTYYIPIVLVSISVIFGFIFLLRLPGVRYAANRVLLATPVAGRITLDYNMATLARIIGLLLKSGVPIVEALRITSDIMPNIIYKRALLDASDSVRRGEPLYKYLDSKPHLFTVTLNRMIQIGERTGNLDTNLNYLSDFYENELNEKVKNLSTILEPALMIFMGLLVGFVAISIITPIYQVTQNIRR